MRRLGIVLGVLGCATGGYGSFLSVSDFDYREYSAKIAFGPNYVAPAMSPWFYLWLVALPILCFVIPWGVVRVVSWLLVGFVEPSSTAPP